MKRLMNILFALLLTVQTFAQTSISGTVKDNRGEPVIGAVVMLNGSKTVAYVTDIDGKWNLTIPSGSRNPVLNISCLGYSSLDVPVEGRRVLNIVLADDTQSLEEVVVVGYGSMRKSDLTGSVTSVRIDDDLAGRSSSVSELLQGHAAGVQVLSDNASPDAGVSIRVRGMTSLNGSNDPLYVVDGVILTPMNSSESMITIGSDNAGTDEAVNGLMGLNPQDIENIEILKDASATAIYGSLGANGVVLITTKTAKSDKPVISFSGGVDISAANRKMEVLGFDEYVDFLEAQDAAGSSTAMKYLSQIYKDPKTRSGLQVKPMDWQDYVFRTAVSQRYHFSISGRPKTLSYSFALGYSDKEGVVKNSGVQQYTVRLNLDKKIGRNFKIGTRINLAYVDSKLTQGKGTNNSAASSLMRSILSYRPYRTFVDEEDPDDDEEASSKAGPDKWLSDFVNTRKEYRITPNLYAEWKIADWVSFKSSIGGDYRDRQKIKFKSSRINSTAEASIGAKGAFTYLNWNWDNTFNFNKQFKKHRISGTAGISASRANSNTQTVQGWNIEQFRALDAAISSAPNSSIAYSEDRYSLLSFIARAVYSYDDRYVVTATYRADGSSKFQGRNKWAHFPSCALAWRISQEPWFNVRDISQVKLRLGWGQVGNQSLPSYQTTFNYSSVTVPDHTPGNSSEASIGLAPSNLANPDLKWETEEQYNVGLDMGFWKGRLAFSLDGYYKITKDLLQTKNIATSTGFSSMWVNEGSVVNRGLEFQLDAVPVKTADFEWSLSGNISLNRNRVASISETADTRDIWITPDRQQKVKYFYGAAPGGSGYATYPASIFMEGYPMGLFYGFKTDGIVQEGETGPGLAEGEAPRGPGSIRYRDLNGNGYIDDDDRTIIGNPNPDFTYGLSTTFSYKGLTVGLSLSGTYGNDLINVNNFRETDTRSSNHNVLRASFRDAWTPENPGAAYYSLRNIDLQETRYIKERDVEDGSYLRISNLTVGYDIPIKKSARVLKRAKVSFSVGNPFVFTKYSGWDPDVNSFGTDIRRMGCDVGSYPGARTYSFDLKFTF